MLTWILALSSTAHAGDPVRLSITEAGVSKVVLSCSGKLIEAPVRDGQASIAQNPGKCEVMMLVKTGMIDGPGEYTCDMRGCRQVDVIHRQIEAAAGRATVVITDKSTTLLELKCPSGYRQRARVDTNTAVFDNVPEEDCDMFWKGGTAPAKAQGIRPGTWYCQATGSTGVCQRR